MDDLAKADNYDVVVVGSRPKVVANYNIDGVAAGDNGGNKHDVHDDNKTHQPNLVGTSVDEEDDNDARDRVDDAEDGHDMENHGVDAEGDDDAEVDNTAKSTMTTAMAMVQPIGWFRRWQK